MAEVDPFVQASDVTCAMDPIDLEWSQVKVDPYRAEAGDEIVDYLDLIAAFACEEVAIVVVAAVD